jgi:hypothetical protein
MSPPGERLGPPLETRGRVESGRRQWAQASLLGGLLALFLAPGLGFPILSGEPRYGLFALSVLALAVALALLAKVLRRNLGIVLHERGLILVRGGRRRIVRFEDIRRARYEPDRRRLILELGAGERIEERWPRGLGAWVVACASAQLEGR